MLKFKKVNSGMDIEYTVGDTFAFNISSDNEIAEETVLRLQISPNGNDNNVIIEKGFEVAENAFAIVLEETELAILNEGRSYQYRLTFIDISGNIVTTVSGNLIVKWGA